MPGLHIGELIGGPDRDRTDDLFHAMEARSQLRHRPTCCKDATLLLSLLRCDSSNRWRKRLHRGDPGDDQGHTFKKSGVVIGEDNTPGRVRQRVLVLVDASVAMSQIILGIVLSLGECCGLFLDYEANREAIKGAEGNHRLPQAEPGAC